MARMLSTIALILAILVHPIGLVLGIIALVRSKNAGEKDPTAIAAIIIAAAFIMIRLVALWYFGEL